MSQTLHIITGPKLNLPGRRARHVCGQETLARVQRDRTDLTPRRIANPQEAR